MTYDFVKTKIRFVIFVAFLIGALLMATPKIVYSQVPPEALVKAQITGGKPIFRPPKTLVIPIPQPGQISEGSFEIRITNENNEEITAGVECEWIKVPQGVEIATDLIKVPASGEGQIGAVSVNQPIFHVLSNAQPGTYEIKLELYIYEIGGRPLDRKISIDPTVILTSVPVGGYTVPIDKHMEKPDLLAPYIGLASTIMIATAIYVKRIKHRKEKQ